MEELKLFSHNWLLHFLNNRAFNANRDVFKGRVLDMGCGTCPYKEDILQAASEYVGIDWAEDFHKSDNIDFLADLNEPLPLAGDSASTIVAFQLLEHLREPARFLAECHRILEEGGEIFITVPFMWHVHDQPHDYYRFTEHGLRHLFATAGFSDIQVERYSGFWPVWVLRFNYYSLKLAKRYLRPMWRLIWFIDQSIAVFLDGFDSYPVETTHYWVRAKKQEEKAVSAE